MRGGAKAWLSGGNSAVSSSALETDLDPGRALAAPHAGPAGIWIVASPDLPFGEVRPLDYALGKPIGRVGLSPGDGRLSREHFQIERAPLGRERLRDLASRNGTFLNGRRAELVELSPGDVIRAGQTILVVGAATAEVPGDDLGLVGVSAGIRALRAAVRRYGVSDVTVLIHGETGVGKELVARALHDVSRRAGEFVACNTVNLREGTFESELFGHVVGSFTGASRPHEGLFGAAAGGTLFLDEIGELHPDVQTRLLRAIELRAVRGVGEVRERNVDVRIVAATNRELERAVRERTFRADLYARIAEPTVQIQPLRTRREDVVPLVAHFLRKGGAAVPPSMPRDFVEALVLYDWPGNVRELERLVHRMALDAPDPHGWSLSLLRPTMRARVEQPEPGAAASAGVSTPEPRAGGLMPSREALEIMLREAGGSVRAVAKKLGRDRKQIYRWARAHGLDLAALRAIDGASEDDD